MDLSYHWRIFFISTHALTEGDAQNIYDSISAGHFNSRPHGGRQRTRADDNTGGVFQLTPSRRATTLMTFSEKSISFQLTPSRRATINHDPDAILMHISTHALTEGDAFVAAMFSKDEIFQLTPSRRATSAEDDVSHDEKISTHALTEGDVSYNGTYRAFPFQLTPSRRATKERR